VGHDTTPSQFADVSFEAERWHRNPAGAPPPPPVVPLEGGLRGEARELQAPAAVVRTGAPYDASEDDPTVRPEDGPTAYLEISLAAEPAVWQRLAREAVVFGRPDFTAIHAEYCYLQQQVEEWGGDTSQSDFADQMNGLEVE